jgi:pimeloyl-ACP methyl ester carboxylesterase
MHPVAEMLADTYRIYNLDLPGHGRTPPPPEAWGVPEYAALVARFMELQVRTPTTLIGHSNGGRIGLYLASESGMDHLIQQLVLVSPSGIRPVRPWTFYLKKYTAKSLKAPFMILPEPIRSHCLDWLRHTLLWKALGSSDYRSLQGVMRETFVKTVNYYVEDRLDRINVPTLLFWGDQDTAVSRREMEMLEKHIPDAGLVVLKGAGHYGYLDDPVTFRAAVRHFLGGI